MKRIEGTFWASRRQLAALLVLVICVAVGGATAAGASRKVAAQTALSKMGVASSFYLSNAPRKLSTIGASWVYNWLPEAPASDVGMQWVPMVPTAASVTPGVLNSLKAAKLSGRAEYLLGFNEPDMTSESDMSPEQAADLWPKLESTGLQLGSPAPARPKDGWLAQFMLLARQRHLRVNFITLHYYQDFTNPAAVAWLRGQLIQIHRTYNKPIWITEIGAVDLSDRPMLRSPTPAVAAAYLRKLFAMLNALPFVQRYAWFTDSASAPSWAVGALFNASGQLTQTGLAYQQIADTLKRAKPNS